MKWAAESASSGPNRADGRLLPVDAPPGITASARSRHSRAASASVNPSSLPCWKASAGRSSSAASVGSGGGSGGGAGFRDRKKAIGGGGSGQRRGGRGASEL